MLGPPGGCDMVPASVSRTLERETLALHRWQSGLEAEIKDLRMNQERWGIIERIREARTIWRSVKGTGLLSVEKFSRARIACWVRQLHILSNDQEQQSPPDAAQPKTVKRNS